MNTAQTRKLRRLKAGDHAQNLLLRPVFHLGLKAHDVEERTQRVVASKLHDGMGFHIRLVRIGQAHGLHRAVAKGFAAPFGHHLNGQAAVEVFCRFARFEFGFLSSQ